jgi:outer membrane immunogenic protein
MLKKSFVVGSLLALSVVTGASAADLPRKTVAPVFAQAPAFSWTGFYIGVNAGWGSADFNRSAAANRAFFPANLADGTDIAGTRKINANGFTGGAQLGYNYQIGSFVLGLEGDFNLFSAKKSVGPELSPGIVSYSSASKVEWLATVRPRLGVAFDRFLVYATGGFAFASVKVSDQFNYIPSGAPGIGLAATSSNTRTGYTIGAGLEYAFTNNLTVKAEYLFVDLGKTSYVHGAVPGFPTSTVNMENKTRLNIVRAGVNYKF